MLCKNCEVPMTNEKGSEIGESNEEVYITSEIKVCPKCGMRVNETYSATILTHGKLPEIDFDKEVK